LAFFEGQSQTVTSGGVKQFIYRAETNQTPPLLAAFNPSLTSKDKTVSFLIQRKYGHRWSHPCWFGSYAAIREKITVENDPTALLRWCPSLRHGSFGRYLSPDLGSTI
jgi:hypothetical protein